MKWAMSFGFVSFGVLIAAVAMVAVAEEQDKEETSILRTKDANSVQIRAFLGHLAKGDLESIKPMLSEDVVASINSKRIQGRDEYLAMLADLHDQLFKDVRFNMASVHTNYFGLDAIAPNGKTYEENGAERAPIWTNVWTALRATGRNTGDDVSVPMHMDFLWGDGKIKMILGYHDSVPFTTEREALSDQ